jgi:hypothetical protein
MRGSNVLVLASLIHTCTLAFDVGTEAYFDPDDGEAWELNYGYYPYRSYQTTDLISPQFRNMVDSPQCHDNRYTFFTPRGFSISAPGPMIVDSHGELVWAKSTEGQAYDFKVQEYKGEQYLTYWQGDDKVRGHGAGDYYMVCFIWSAVLKQTLISSAQYRLPRSTQDFRSQWSSSRPS